MFSLLDIIMLVIGVLILVIWFSFYTTGSKFSSLFDGLLEEEYPLKELYYMGYAVLDKTHFDFKNNLCRKLRKELGVLYGDKYADYYLRVVYSQKITFAMLIITLCVPMYFLLEGFIGFVLMLVLACLAYYYYGTVPSKKIEARSQEMISDFSNMVSKLALMTNAGMILREAWAEVAKTSQTPLYLEMQKAVEDMHNGVSEVDAFYNFGMRCMIPEVKKFTSTIIQGLLKGNSELSMVLSEQSKEVWNMKKNVVRRSGELASSKLLFPIIVMFMGILIMIMVPMFMNIGM